MQESSFLKDEGLLILSILITSRIKQMSFMLHLIKFYKQILLTNAQLKLSKKLKIKE